MRDIAGAIEMERAYLDHRMKGEEPFHLADAIKEFGFNSLDEYFREKKSYQFLHMNFKWTEVKQAEIVSEAARILTNKLVGIWSADSDTTCIFNGFSGTKSFNERYCIENNIPVFPLLADGGTIVHQKGDYSWGVACPINLGMNAHFFLALLKDILQKHTAKEVVVDGNDILVDGEKVCGSTVYNKNGIFLFISYFSFNDKSKLIDEICNKKSKKTPSYISFMTREEFKREIEEMFMAFCEQDK